MAKINLELLKKYFWLIGLVAGLIGLISAFLPCWGVTEGGGFINVWYWGFYFDTGFDVMNEPQVVAPGIVAAIILLAGAALILYSAVSAKIRDEPKTTFSLIGGIILLVAPSFFLITMASLFPGFWDEIFAGIGLVLPYIGGFIAIFSWFLMRRK